VKSISEIQAHASALLEKQPVPAAHLRLLRDVLFLEQDQEEVRAVFMLACQSRQVHLLEDEQRPDGSWGAFHSRSTASKQKIPSTEVAVERAICLGLHREHPVLARAKEYILSIMRGEIRFPDYHEKNDRWPTGMRLFLASTISQIDPSHEILDWDRSLWREIAIRTFQSGNYCVEDEIQAHKSLTGATVKDSYLRINNRHTLNILGSRRELLPPAVEGGLLDWLWNHDQGIGYLGVPLAEEPPRPRSGPLDRWFTSQEMIIRLFHRAASNVSLWIDWIWNQKDSEALWDFGSRSASSAFFPLAEDWKKKNNRKIDWSTRVLLLAASCASAGSA
jgi:hypothetical protein